MKFLKYDKSVSFVLVILFAIFFYIGAKADELQNADPSSVYYVRLDQKIVNGTYVTDSLTMVPADGDYRMLPFKRHVVTGNVVAASKADTLTAAKHNAMERLLITEGTKSVRSISEKDTKSTYEENVASYEGYILIPYRVQNGRYSKDGTVFSIDIEIDFAPLSYPPEWSYRFFKKKVNDTIGYILSLFM
jgi:hypothetical protein